jgi:hypothetical protein
VPFLAVLLVAGADWFGWLAGEIVRRLDRDRVVVHAGLTAAIVAAIMPSLFIPYERFNSATIPGQEYRSSVAPVEYQLAEWFRENTEENIRIISDNQTMLLLTSMANKVSLTERRFHPLEMSEEGRNQMSRLKAAVLQAPASSWAYAGIVRLQGSEPESERRFMEAAGFDDETPRYFLVWTHRTCLWARDLGIGPLRALPWDGEVFPSQVRRFDEPYFRKVAQFGNQAYVFEVAMPENAGPEAVIDPNEPRHYMAFDNCDPPPY